MNPSIQTLIQKMRYHDQWYKNDFAQILAYSNPDKGNDFFFRDCIYSAVRGGTCKSLEDYVGVAVINGKTPIHPSQYNYPFKPVNLINFANSKGLLLPNEFDEIEINQNHDPMDLNIIAAMLHTFLSEGAGGAANSRFHNQTALVEHISNNYKGKLTGTSARTLQEVFSIANKILVDKKIK